MNPGLLESFLKLKNSAARVKKRSGLQIEIYSWAFRSDCYQAYCHMDYKVGARAALIVYVSDSMVRDFSQEMLDSVVAHEIGHYHSGDFNLLTRAVTEGMPYFYAFLACLPLAIDSGVTMPWVVAGTLSGAFLGLLIQKSMKRQFELSADIFAARISGAMPTYTSLACLVNPAPGSSIRGFDFFQDHPSLRHRLKELEKRFPEISRFKRKNIQK